MNAPQQITVHAASGRLSLTWDDGRTQSIDNATLRKRCPCSTCRRLAHSGEARLDSPPVAIVDMQPMGYGMQIVFSDGHAQGIYPWEYLKRID
ncbi:DUF971 domain-containing protein [Paraburkholderia aromaticivorans]|uniref:DUF971 domain-containing protein n=1 Tax=Paraburkholderia aromaticivorans TaxID=2026199 RepID=UPI001455FB7D|nr:DUF971 domain-containing protein [Paraburkholderia aromaticivorans]